MYGSISVINNNDITIFDENRNIKEFITNLSRGPYTAALLLNNNYELISHSLHIKRLYESYNIIFGVDKDINIVNIDRSYVCLIKCLYKYKIKEHLPPYKIILVLTRTKELYCLMLPFNVSLLQDYNQKSLVCVGIAGKPRYQYLAKNSQWIDDRLPLEEMKIKNKWREIILCDEDGNLLEGLVHNFFIVTNDNVICTPKEKVLLGTARDSILNLCHQHHIHIEESAINILQHHQWKSAFISNALSGITIIKQIQLPNNQIVHLNQHDISKTIQYHYHEHILSSQN